MGRGNHGGGKEKNKVPRAEHRVTKKVESPCCSPVLIFNRAPVHVELSMDDEEGLPLPSELWLRVVYFASAVDLGRCEAISKALRVESLRHSVVWEALSELHFPTMCRSVRDSGPNSKAGSASSPCTSPYMTMQPPRSRIDSNDFSELPSSAMSLNPPRSSNGKNDFAELPTNASSFELSSSTPAPAWTDWKLLYVRRLQKQQVWGTRGRSGSSLDTSIASDHAGASGCGMHSGDFLPEEADGWSQPELQQLQVFVRAARNHAVDRIAPTIGSKGKKRGSKSNWEKSLTFTGWGTYGHWAEGLGAQPKSKNLRDCIEGKVPCVWSCCDSETLISKGCKSLRQK